MFLTKYSVQLEGTMVRSHVKQLTFIICMAVLPWEEKQGLTHLLFEVSVLDLEKKWGQLFILGINLKDCRRQWGAWVTQSVKRPALDFGSGHDLRDVRSSPLSGSTLSAESAWDSLSLPLPLPCLHTHTFSFSKIKLKKNKIKDCQRQACDNGVNVVGK